MSININGKLWTPQEREEVINHAVQKFLSKRRTKKAVEPPAKSPRTEPDIFIEDSSDSSDNDTDSSFGIQKITLKQTEPMTQKLIKSIQFQLEY